MVDYKDFSADGVHFQLQLVPDRVSDLLAAGAHAKLKLVTRISTGMLLNDVVVSAAAASPVVEVNVGTKPCDRGAMLSALHWDVCSS